jgi:drug/metabolite transporter (DMT)-like permease
VVAWLSWVHGVEARPSAWLGFAYVTLFSQLLGFFAWYKALAIGGIARVSQVQLLQTFMTLGFAAVVAGERPSLATWAFAVAVVAVVAAQRASAIAFVPRGASAVAAAPRPGVAPAPAQVCPASPTDTHR